MLKTAFSLLGMARTTISGLNQFSLSKFDLNGAYTRTDILQFFSNAGAFVGVSDYTNALAQNCYVIPHYLLV